MQLLYKTKRFVFDFVEITVISVLGLMGLLFIMTMPFEPPEDRHKSLQQRLKEAVHEIKNALAEVFIQHK